MLFLKSNSVPWDQTVSHFRKIFTKGTGSSIIAAFIKITSSNNEVLLLSLRQSSFSQPYQIAAISTKHILILCYSVLSCSTEYPRIYFFTCSSTSLPEVALSPPCQLSIKHTVVFPKVGYEAEVKGMKNSLSVVFCNSYWSI